MRHATLNLCHSGKPKQNLPAKDVNGIPKIYMYWYFKVCNNNAFNPSMQKACVRNLVVLLRGVTLTVRALAGGFCFLRVTVLRAL